MPFNNVPVAVYDGVKSKSSYGLLTLDGKVYTVGFDGENAIQTPTLRFENVSEYNPSYYLTTDGELHWIYNIREAGQNPSYDEGDILISDGVAQANARYFLKTDGTVWTYWADSSQAKLVLKAEPTKIMSDVVKIAYSNTTYYFLKADGSLWSVGNNEYGQCGNGECGDLDLANRDCVVTQPYKVMDGVRDVFPREGACYAVTTDNELYGWGLNRYDLMLTGGEPKSGVSPTTRVAQTTPVAMLTGVKDFYPSAATCFAIMTDDTLWSWGVANRGLLGNGIQSENPDKDYYDMSDESAYSPIICEPQKIMDNVKQLYGYALYSGGSLLTIAEQNDGSLWYWGYDEIIVNESDDWNTGIKFNCYYSKRVIISTPQPFDIHTFHSEYAHYKPE